MINCANIRLCFLELYLIWRSHSGRRASCSTPQPPCTLWRLHDLIPEVDIILEQPQFLVANPKMVPISEMAPHSLVVRRLLWWISCFLKEIYRRGKSLRHDGGEKWGNPAWWEAGPNPGRTQQGGMGEKDRCTVASLQSVTKWVDCQVPKFCSCDGRGATAAIVSNRGHKPLISS